MKILTIATSLVAAGVLTACVSMPGSSGDTGEADAGAGPVAAAVENWQLAAESATQTAFVDVGSLQAADNGLRAVAKINFSQPQPWAKSAYLSARNTYLMDCASRRLADRENLIFEGPDFAGKRLSRASRSGNNLIWRDVAAGTVEGEILNFACRQASPR
ncbi:MAG: hypothetical protein LBE59_08875 [Nevskiaceae bacterium]|nr:hypothetical protein [Nevskiaceae bacterium]